MTTPTDILSRFDEKQHARKLADALTPRYLDLLELAWNEQAERLPVLGAFDVSNPRVKATVKNLAKRVTGMASTTKDDIRTVLERVFDMETTPGVDTIAAALREYGVTSSKSRSLTIARTETTTAYNHGAVMSYREAGVERVEILDSDNDEECAARNGKIVTLDEALAIEPHPNCVMAFAPVVEGIEKPDAEDVPAESELQFETVRDAEEWAAENLMTEFGSMKGVSIETATDTLRVVADIERRVGRGIPSPIEFSGVKGRAYASYDIDQKKILLRKRYADIEGSLENDNQVWIARYGGDVPYTVATDFESVLYHEVGHAFDAESGWKLSRSVLDLPLSEKRDIIKVSGYATEDFYTSTTGKYGTEAWAEAWTAVATNSPRAKFVPDSIREKIEGIIK